MSTTKHYTIKITGGTSPGPYTIYYGTFPNPPLFTGSIVPPIYPIGSPPVLAQNLSLSSLTGVTGVIVDVPSATTAIYLYNQLCPDKTITLIPTKNIVYQDFCMTSMGGATLLSQIHFIFNNMDANGNPTWVGTYIDNNITMTATVNWVDTQWVVIGYNPLDGTITSPNDINSNPPSIWVVNGSRATTTSTIGDCVITNTTSYPVSINQPTCLCDGSILFNPTNLDNPPFTYSINNGVTYSNSPIFSNLCSGIYNLSILDSLDNNYSKTITLNKPTVATTYTLSLNTTQSTQINNPTTISKTYETTIIVTPELPDGTTVYFDIVHNNSFYSGPLSGTSILTTGTLLYKNEVPVSLSSTFSGDSTSVNTSPSCQSNTIYQFNTSDSWNSLSLTNSDIITISTSTRVDKTTLGLCSVGYSNESYSITNASIKGCSCCEIINT